MQLLPEQPEALGLLALMLLHDAKAGEASSTDWVQIAALYGALYAMMPTAIVELNKGESKSKNNPDARG